MKMGASHKQRGLPAGRDYFRLQHARMGYELLAARDTARALSDAMR